MRLFDSHAHIQAEEYAADIDEVIARAREAGVERVLLPSDELSMARAGIELACGHEGLYASAGIHPHNASSVNDEMLDELDLLLAREEVVALGEIGLDYFYMHSPREAQITAFEAQLELASRVGLPVIVHTRDAWEDTRAVLESWTAATPQPPGAPGHAPLRTDGGSAEFREAPRGVMHYFTGSVEDGLRFIEMGFLLSIHTSVTFKNAAAQRDVVAKLPLQSLVIETDSPFGAPQGYRGKRNEPAYVTEVAKMIAELQGVNEDEVAEATYANACRLFRLPIVTGAAEAGPPRQT
jgi:TatD DNase family protein